jgi:hypothetical protein
MPATREIMIIASQPAQGGIFSMKLYSMEN